MVGFPFVVGPVDGPVHTRFRRAQQDAVVAVGEGFTAAAVDGEGSPGGLCAGLVGVILWCGHVLPVFGWLAEVGGGGVGAAVVVAVQVRGAEVVWVIQSISHQISEGSPSSMRGASVPRCSLQSRCAERKLLVFR